MINIYDYLKTIEYEKQDFLDDVCGKKYVLFLKNGKCLKVSELTERIISNFNGERTLDEVLESLNKDCINITKDNLVEIICKKLMPTGIFGISKNIDKDENTKFWFHFPLLNGQKLKNMLSIFKIFFNKKLVVCQLVILFISQIFLLITNAYKNLFLKLSVWHWFFFIICIIYLFIFHELGHAAAAVFYKCKLGKIGIGLYLFRPVLYIDLSDTWRLTKKKRIITDLGGIYFQIIFSNTLFICYIFLNSKIFLLVMLFNILLAVFNLNPFLKLDGYWVLSDYLGVSNVNEKAFMYLNYLKTKIGKNKNIELPQFNHKVKKVMHIYIAIYLIVTIIMFLLGIYMCATLIFNPLEFKNNIIECIQVFKAKKFQHAIILCISILTRILPIIYFLFLTLKYIRKYIKEKNRSAQKEKEYK